MAHSLVKELRKIQLSGVSGSDTQKRFVFTAERCESKSIAEVKRQHREKPCSSRPSSAAYKHHEKYSSVQTPLRIRVKPSPPSISKPRDLPKPVQVTAEESPERCVVGYRYQADGDSVGSLEADDYKERLPGDGCISTSDDEASNCCDSNVLPRKSSLIDISDGEYQVESFDSNLVSLDDFLDQDVEDIDDTDVSEGSLEGESVNSDDDMSKSSEDKLQSRPASSALRKQSTRPRSVRRVARSSTPDFHRKSNWVQEKQNSAPFPLVQSLFANVPPTILFTIEGEEVSPFPPEVRKLLRWKLSTITPKVVKSCILRSGFKLSKKTVDWLGYWGKHMKAASFKSLREYQKLNHFPGTFQIGRKDRLWRNFSKMQLQFGKKEFNFVPQTYVLPNDIRTLRKIWEEHGQKQKWIIKPPASARGIGIKVINKWSQLPKKRAVIVQRYLSKPYLINGSKFDIRIYVYVTSFDPLRIYIFDDGLVRFATSKYSSSSKTLSNKYIHLTNYSINKKNLESYTPSFDEETCEGHKWSLKSLFQYLKKKGIDSDRVWKTIKDIVVKTIICAEPTVNTLVKQNVKSRYCCHELFGYDIIFDDHLKPWLLEVNISPSLHSNSPLDVAIKSQLVKDMLNLSGFRIPKPALVPRFLRNLESKQMSSESIWFEQVPLTTDEKYKHAYFTQRRVDENVKGTILDLLTPDDIRILMETEDELSRCGNFERVFPSTVSDKYLKFFDTPRYYNMLLDEWVKRYRRDAYQPAVGTALLLGYSKRGLHLGVTDDPAHQWGNSRHQLPLRSTSAPAQLPYPHCEKPNLPTIQSMKKPKATKEKKSEDTASTRRTSLTAQVTRKVSSMLQGRLKNQ